jgi:pyruvate/2-oxoglutarate dehydrogenase complex dihydrolipoamide dehydrogenase (E3) component
MKKYDIAVIGAGSAGLVAATTAHRLGLKTVFIEKNKIGGECTHYGCIPSKAMLNSAKAFHALAKTTDLGIPQVALEGQLDFSILMQSVDDIVQRIYAHETPEVFEEMGIDVIVNSSGAQFLDNTTIQVGKETISSKYSIICTGSSPRKLNIPGSENIDFLHNENFWEIREQPASIAFIGGGVVSAELGQTLARFGTEVTIIDRNSKILKTIDEEAQEIICGIFEKEGIKIVGNANPVRFEGKRLILDQNGKEISVDTEKIFVAIGRVPNIKGMQLENTGITYSDRGIQTNEFLQTTTSNIYACGDVMTPHKFTHTASHQANICVHNILNGNSKINDLSVLPWAIFTDPEIAHVGLSEKAAREKFGDSIQVFKVDATIDRFVTDRKTVGFLKVIFDENNLVIGANAIGQYAGEWLQMLTIVIKNKIPAESMADTIFTYPTYSEIVKKAFTRFLRTKQ